MNDIVLAVLNHDYKDEELKKQVHIYKRTNKERIKNKVFTKLFSAFMKEKELVKIGDIVLMNTDVYQEMNKSIADISESFGKLKEELTATSKTAQEIREEHGIRSLSGKRLTDL